MRLAVSGLDTYSRSPSSSFGLGISEESHMWSGDSLARTEACSEVGSEAQHAGM